jgi:hypothetical protein
MFDFSFLFLLVYFEFGLKILGIANIYLVNTHNFVSNFFATYILKFQKWYHGSILGIGSLDIYPKCPWEKNKKLTEERAKQAELLQTVHARATIDALAKQAALHAVAMLKCEAVNQFTADHLGSTASSVSSAMAAWHPSSPSLSSTHEPPPNPAAPSRLGVPSSEVHFMVAGGGFSPIIDLNRTPLVSESLSGYSKTPRACAPEDLPDAAGLFGPMPTQPMVDKVLP